VLSVYCICIYKYTKRVKESISMLPIVETVRYTNKKTIYESVDEEKHCDPESQTDRQTDPELSAAVINQTVSFVD
jgi:hypothetical protein